jgi:tetrapyrrole methylase family protein/MazG family protein
MSDTSARRPPAPIPSDDPRVFAWRRLVGVIDRLREPDGCPWDLKQTAESMAPHLIEEAHELLEAIEAGEPEAIAEEAGDVLMNVALICRIGMEHGEYDLTQAADAITEKLIRRHPHVFGDVQADTSEAVLANWEAIKKVERQDAAKDDSALAGVPKSLPALQRARRMCDKAVTAGFRWQSVAGAYAKLTEELGELAEVLPKEVLEGDFRPELAPDVRARIEHELGDVLLAGAFLGEYLGLDPERLCRDAVRRFEGRFRSMERDLGGSVAGPSLEELLAAWERAKASNP